MDFMSRIFAQRSDEQIHRQFVRFGKGIFENRALISLTKGKEIKINSSFEYVHDFLNFVSELVQKINVSGIVLSKEPLNLGASVKKSGLYNYEIEREILSEDLKNILAKSYSALFDAKAEGIELKCKKKLPKPGKSGEGKIDDKFCVLILDERYAEQARQYFFHYAPVNAKKVKTKYSVRIDDIIPPVGENDFEKIRLLAKRKGTITRIAEIDKQEQRKEIDFCV